MRVPLRWEQNVSHRSVQKSLSQDKISKRLLLSKKKEYITKPRSCAQMALQSLCYPVYFLASEQVKCFKNTKNLWLNPTNQHQLKNRLSTTRSKFLSFSLSPILGTASQRTPLKTKHDNHAEDVGKRTLVFLQLALLCVGKCTAMLVH